MIRYVVVAPPYLQGVPPSDYLPECGRPWEEAIDYWEGEAVTPQQAKVLAVRFWRAEHRRNWREYQHVGDADSDGRCPFTGLKVYLAEEKEKL